MSEVQGSLRGAGEGLSGVQEVALAALRGGQTFVGAAEQAGVSRMTLYRWLRGNPHFRAAFNAWQQEVTDSARARLVKLADRAVDVVEQALGRNDEKVALKVLRSVGVIRKRSAGGSINPEVLKLKMELREKRELHQAEMKMLHYLMKKAGIPPEQRKAMIAGGPRREEFVEEDEQDSDRAGQPGDGPPAASDSGQDAPRPVTPQAPRGPAQSEGNVSEETGNDWEEPDLEMELSAAEDGLGDVTDDVTAGRASHPFAMANER